jgi:hypothetical protein
VWGKGGWWRWVRGGLSRGSGGAASGSGTGTSAAGVSCGLGGVMSTPARFNGVPVCFGYNSRNGCKRAPAGAYVCKDGATTFAHVCNLFVKGNRQPAGLALPGAAFESQ